MTPESAFPQIQTEPGHASAEEGFVVLDGPDGVAVTMTAHAAAGTGHSLLAAAEAATAQTNAGLVPPTGNPADPD